MIGWRLLEIPSSSRIRIKNDLHILLRIINLNLLRIFCDQLFIVYRGKKTYSIVNILSIPDYYQLFYLRYLKSKSCILAVYSNSLHCLYFDNGLL